MIQKIRKIIITTGAAFTLLLFPAMVPAMASAQTTGDIQNCLSQGTGLISGASGNTTCAPSPDTGTAKVQAIVTLIINLFSIIVGIVAIIMIVVGGFRYITSGGDSGNITSAKNTIVYAVIGLVIVALAQFIVKFVLNKVTTAA